MRIKVGFWTGPFECPCGGKVWASLSWPVNVTHSNPPCEQFLKLEPDDFITLRPVVP
jgi:hypothetical protein